jgi:hypothetical protein
MSRPCPFDRFPTGLKLLMRVLLFGFAATGAAAVFLASVPWGLAYLAFLGLTGMVVLRGFCAHCPYPYEHGDCLALPAAFHRSVLPRRPGPLNRTEVVAFTGFLTASILLPQIALVRRPVLLAVYWALCLPTCFVFPFYICRRCRFVHCPFRGSDLKKAS